MDWKQILGDDADDDEATPGDAAARTLTHLGVTYPVRHDDGTPDVTARCKKFLQVMDAAGIGPVPWDAAVGKLLDSITARARAGIREFLVFPAQRFISVRTTRHAEPFARSYEVGCETGWYYYVTGVDLPAPVLAEKLDAKYQSDNPFQRALQAYRNLPRGRFAKTSVHKLHEAKLATAPRLALNQDLRWDGVSLWCVTDAPNSHSFLVEVAGEPDTGAKPCRVLLDCGITPDNFAAWDFLQDHPPHWVVITHAHKDHAQGWPTIADRFPGAIFLCSRTTMAFLLVDYRRGKGKGVGDSAFFALFANRVYCPIFGKPLKIGRSGTLRLLRSGHVPGAAAVHLTMGDHSLLFTGDFTWEPCYPLASFAESLADLPQDLNVDVLLADGSNARHSRPPLPNIFQQLYSRARASFDAGGTVAIATDPGSLALVAFHQFFELGRAAGDTFPIYLHPKVFTYMNLVNHYMQDLPLSFGSQVANRRNPFASWRVQRLEGVQDYYSALSGASTVLTYPVDINTPPFNQLFPLFALNEHNLLVLGHFTEDDTTRSLREATPTELEVKTDLGGLCTEPVVVRVQPRYKTYNQEVDYFQLPTHPCQENITQLKTLLRPIQYVQFHNRNAQLSPQKIIYP